MLSSESLGALSSNLAATGKACAPRPATVRWHWPSCSSSSQTEHSALTRRDPVHTEMSPVT